MKKKKKVTFKQFLLAASRVANVAVKIAIARKDRDVVREFLKQHQEAYRTRFQIWPEAKDIYAYALHHTMYKLYCGYFYQVKWGELNKACFYMLQLIDNGTLEKEVKE